MTPSRRIRRLWSLAPLALIVGVTACGADDNTTTTVPQTTAAPMTTEAPAMTTQAPMTTEMPGTMDGPFGPACAMVPADGPGSFDGMAVDPAATAASNNPILSTLVSAVSAAGLVDTLNGEGPFTIFAPTNDAFDAVPAADLEAVLADTDLLTSVLTYHVVAGERLTAAELAERGTVETVNGARLTIGSDGTVVNGAQVVCANVMTANATVHIIDGVLLPS